MKLKSTIAALLVLSLAIVAVSCTAAQREQAGQAAQIVDGLATELDERKDDPIGDLAGLVYERLADMHGQGLLLQHDYDAALAALEQSVAEIDKQLPAPETVDLWITEARRVQAALEGVANAPDDTTAVAEAITGAAAVAAPLAGPYAPWVTIGGAALAAMISGFGGLFAGRHQGVSLGIGEGVQKTALPIDDARDTHLEAELSKQHPGRRYLVVDRDKVAKGHLRSGVAQAIETATTAS